MGRIRIYLTGRLTIEVDDRLISDDVLASDEERLSFAFLVLERRRAVALSEIAQALWDDERPQDWRQRIDTSVGKIQSVVGDLDRDDIAVEEHGGLITLRLPLDVWVDIDHAHRSLEMAAAAKKEGDLDRAASLSTHTAVIGKRPFLPGIESKWVGAQRARHKAVLIDGLDTLAESEIELGLADDAVGVARQALEHQPLHEPSLRALMRALDAVGNRAGALKTYEEYRVELAKSLGTAPSKKTEKLAAEMRTTTTADLDVLTPREQEVALLLAEGLTNREIARRLFISVQTSETHVKHILTKLNLSSRTQVAAWVTARGLAGPTEI